MKIIIAPLASAILLAACGGSGGGANTGNADADILVSNAENVFDTFNALDENEGFTPFAAVGVENGTSTYSGVAIFFAGTDNGADESVNYAALGSFEAVADFGAGQDVTGTANGFFEVANPEVVNDDSAGLSDLDFAGPIAGSFAFHLDISNFLDTAVVDGVVNGSLTRLDNSQDTFTNAEAFGDFYGNDLDALEVFAGETDGNEFTVLSVTGLR